VVSLAEQILHGLLAFHRRETYHQDLKPDNIMLDADGTVRIIDFGSCHVAGVDEMASPLPRPALLGTAGYSAPEARLGDVAGARGDQFAFGSIVYEMLTGRLLYGEAIERATTRADFGRLEYTPVYHPDARVPVWIDGALRRAVHLDPSARYAELAELMTDLSRPNPAYLRQFRFPLNRADPVRFWQAACAVLALAHLVWISVWALP